MTKIISVILKKAHAYLQTIVKAPVNCQKDSGKDKVPTRNPRTTHYALRTTHHGKPKTMLLRLSSNKRGIIIIILT